jgi:hypothetical protein
MTTQLHARLTPAQAPTTRHPTATTPREEVMAMAVSKSRKARAARAWDELSEIDRMVLLEAVRQRRRLKAQHESFESGLNSLRSWR